MPDSRERILDTAFELVRAQGANAVTMAAIADAAGLSRQMVYVHCHSRAGLLTAMARDRDRRSGFADRVAAARELPPAEALERLLSEWLAYVPEILPVARVPLAAGWTVDTATDWAWARCQPGGYEHLVLERGWSAEDYAERTVRSVLAELLA